VEQILHFVQERRKMNMRSITCASYVLDPRFCGEVLSEEEWATAQETILAMAAEDRFDRHLILGDIVLVLHQVWYCLWRGDSLGGCQEHARDHGKSKSLVGVLWEKETPV